MKFVCATIKVDYRGQRADRSGACTKAAGDKPLFCAPCGRFVLRVLRAGARSVLFDTRRDWNEF